MAEISPPVSVAGISRLFGETNNVVAKTTTTEEEQEEKEDAVTATSPEPVPRAQAMSKQLTSDTVLTVGSQEAPSVVLTADHSDSIGPSHTMNSRQSTYSSRPTSSTYDNVEGTTMGQVLTAQLVGSVNEQLLAEMISLQERTLITATHTHDTLAAFNEFAEARYAELQRRLEHHITFVLGLRKDLDGVFRRLRTLKDQCRDRYPNANQQVRELYPPATYLAEGDDDWDGDPED
ncbi:hypothetical protein BDF19DRAFT_433833 [Syncephalis fuscata]|nr:hypothetical protein BDF19DRAFT_433833 [Syncephalis fuscata]